MPGAVASGTFANTTIAFVGNPSEVCVVPYGTTNIKLTTLGLDGSNTVKTQKRTTPGGAYVDQTTYSTDQTNTLIPVAAGEEWRLLTVTMQTMKDIRYRLSSES